MTVGKQAKSIRHLQILSDGGPSFTGLCQIFSYSSPYNDLLLIRELL